MKSIFVLALLVAGVKAEAVELPIYLGHVKGAVLTGLVGREGFEFFPGEVGQCTRREAMDILFYTCELKNAKTVVTAAGGAPLTVTYDALHVEYHSLKNGDIRRDYHFRGNWEQKTTLANLSSKVRLVLWHLKSAPHDLRGHLKLEDYSTFGAIQATPVP